MKKLFRNYGCFYILLIYSCNTAAQSVVFMNDPARAFNIIISAKAGAIEKEAAATLQKYLQQIFGVKWQITSDAQKATKNEICIGNTNRKTLTGKEGLQEDGVLLRTENGKLFIQGGNRKGVLYATYTFLENYMGCRKYTKDVSFIPQLKNITLPAINYKHNPSFAFRSTHYIDALDKEYCDWHKLNYFFEGFDPYVHSLEKHIPADVYFKKNPEYFALKDGKRVPDQPCLSNPEVLKIVIAHLRKDMEKSPGIKKWPIGLLDNRSYCTCNKCAPVTKAENGYHGVQMKFVDKIAQEFPDYTIASLAYNQTLVPPKTIKPLKNVLVIVCSNEVTRAVPINKATKDPYIYPYTPLFRESLEKWHLLHNNIFVWDYIVQFTNTMSPFPNWQTLKPNLNYFKSLGISQVFSQGAGTLVGEFSELKCYYMAKLMWNTNENEEQVKNSFLQGYYGSKSGAYIGMYITSLTQHFINSGKNLINWDTPLWAKDTYLSSDKLNSYNLLFDKAMGSAANEDQKKRIVKEKLALDYAALEISYYDPSFNKSLATMSQLRSKVASPTIRQQAETFIRNCEKSNVKYLNEAGRTAQGLADLLQQKYPGR